MPTFLLPVVANACFERQSARDGNRCRITIINRDFRYPKGSILAPFLRFFAASSRREAYTRSTTRDPFRVVQAA